MLARGREAWTRGRPLPSWPLRPGALTPFLLVPRTRPTPSGAVEHVAVCPAHPDASPPHLHLLFSGPARLSSPLLRRGITPGPPHARVSALAGRGRMRREGCGLPRDGHRAAAPRRQDRGTAVHGRGLAPPGTERPGPSHTRWGFSMPDTRVPASETRQAASKADSASHRPLLTHRVPGSKACVGKTGDEPGLP